MTSQLASVDKKYDVAKQLLSIHFANKDGQVRSIQIKLNEEECALFDLRWDRFQGSDEIFFDCAEFQEGI